MNHQRINLYTTLQPQGTKPRNPWGFVKNTFKSPKQFPPEHCNKPERSAEARDRTQSAVKATTPSRVWLAF